MGNKKPCSCGFWNEVQQECLYRFPGCVQDEKKEPESDKRWVRGLSGEELKKAFAEGKVDMDELDAEQKKFIRQCVHRKAAEMRALSARGKR